jgi:hypothetical protein
MGRRLVPAIGLFFLAPLIGEFLLGNLSITWLWVLPMMAALYGGGSLLISETVRRLRLGWPSMILLGLAYAVIEEAFVTQSLFNPNYLGLRLLDYGYVPALGISVWWTVFVLGIHTVWSTAVPIAVTESSVPERRHTPWLGRIGLALTAIIFVGGCALLFIFQQQKPFMASVPQLLGSVVVVVGLVIIAISLGRVKPTTGAERQQPPSPHVVGGVFLVLGSAFMSLTFLTNTISAGLNAAGMVVLFLLGGVSLLRWARQPGWAAYHSLAATSGLLLTYGWFGFVQVSSTGGTSPTVDLVGNVVFASCAVALLILAKKRLDHS